jgi:peptidoglycan/xylan/chitin deacetylase (PgdA/CDA1 family)
MRPPILYYRIKSVIPRVLQVSLRRASARARRYLSTPVWPIDLAAGRHPTGFSGWPEGKRFALVLRHDVEGALGVSHVPLLAAVEQERGLRSAFFFVPRRYGNTQGIRSALKSAGFEIGVHGLTHDGMLYSSHRAFRKCIGPINSYLKEWGASGFASPSSHHNFQWLHELDLEYDTSSFDTDPFEPQPDGVRTVFPMLQWDCERKHVYIELPYTLAQDFTVFVILRQNDISTWTRKLDWIADRGGMALLDTHPDYMHFAGRSRRPYTYDVGLYERFLDYVEKHYGGECWYALPMEVARFWRASVLSEQATPIWPR